MPDGGHRAGDEVFISQVFPLYFSAIKRLAQRDDGAVSPQSINHVLAIFTGAARTGECHDGPSSSAMSAVDNPFLASASELAAAVAAGEISARELTSAYFERIETVGSDLNAVVVTDRARAAENAARVDEAVANGAPLGLLAGVPITVKEAFAVEGLPTTAGMAEFAGHVARRDAPAVASLRDAGAIILGTTNVPTQLGEYQSVNPLYGRTANPWDLGRSCGGSSGGSAAAIAAGLSALELGSDLSGSIRLPASWCGVFGLRPSNGRISKLDHLPWPVGGLLEPPTSVVGPMARSVADLSLAFQVLTGAPVAPLPRVEELRIALWRDAEGAPRDEETGVALEEVARRLEAAGVRVDEFVAPYDPPAALELGWRQVHAEISRGLTASQSSDDPTDATTQLVRHYLADQEARLEMSSAWEAGLASFDAVMCPAVSVAALRHEAFSTPRDLVVAGDSYSSFDILGSWSVLTSVAHQPSVTIPAGRGSESGLPIGLQLLGPFSGDERLLSVATVVSELLGAWACPPNYA
jgi:amidase